MLGRGPEADGGCWDETLKLTAGVGTTDIAVECGHLDEDGKFILCLHDLTAARKDACSMYTLGTGVLSSIFAWGLLRS